MGGWGEEALALVRADPGRAEALARQALTGPGDDATAAVALRVLGMVARDRQAVGEAEQWFRAAVDRAEQAADRELAAACRLSLSGALMFQGRGGEALALIDAGLDDLGGTERARARFQRAAVLQVMGRDDDALAAYDVAARALRRVDDRVSLAQLHNNRGVLHMERGRLGEAGVDLRRAERLYDELGLGKGRADVRSHLGALAARAGDVVGALGWYAAADAELAALGVEDPLALLDRLPTFLAAGLVEEARAAAARAVALLRGRGPSTYLADVFRAGADAALAAGDTAAAADLAGLAADLYARYGNERRLVDARAVAALAAAGTAGPAGADDLAAACEHHGLSARAAELRVAAGTAALAAGDRAGADRHLSAASGARRRGTVQERLVGWRAEAERRLAAGDAAGAARAARAGLDLLTAYSDVLGALDLRAHAAGHGAALAALGLRTALRGGRPRAVLGWAERHRAASLQRPAVRPPADPVLARLLGELRAERSDGRRARLEEAVRARARLARPGGPGGPDRAGAAAAVDGVIAALGERALVAFVAAAGRLVAVTAAGGRARLFHLGPTDAVDREARLLRFALARAAGGTAGPVVAGNVRYGAERLDALLVRPLHRALGDRPLVVVPTGPLHALPWAALPSCRGRPVTVAPAASVWGAASRRAEGSGPLALVAGPGLPHADAEVAELARRWPTTTVLTGADATAGAVVAALDAATVAHVAAHGRVRADQPMLSSLRLADGPLTVYDLDRVRTPPALLVLSACDTGLSAVRPGDELMGFVAAVLSMGTRAVVASVGPVPDATARDVMVAFHDRRAAGAPAPDALAAAQAAVGDPTAVLFVHFGA